MKNTTVILIVTLLLPLVFLFSGTVIGESEQNIDSISNFTLQASHNDNFQFVNWSYRSFPALWVEARQTLLLRSNSQEPVFCYIFTPDQFTYFQSLLSQPLGGFTDENSTAYVEGSGSIALPYEVKQSSYYIAVITNFGLMSLNSSQTINSFSESILSNSQNTSPTPSPTLTSTSSPSIPEFPWLVILPLFMFMLSAVVIIGLRKKSLKSSLKTSKFYPISRTSGNNYRSSISAYD